MLVLEQADCAYGYRRNRPATNTGMEKNAHINTGTNSKTGSARTSTGILLIRVLTYIPYSSPVTAGSGSSWKSAGSFLESFQISLASYLR